MPARRWLVISLVWISFAALASACSFDSSAGASFAGQICFEPSDCAEGLACVERRCRPVGGGTTSDAIDDTSDGGGVDDVGADVVIPPDAQDDGAQRCAEEGASRCQGPDTLETCVQGQWVQESCGPTRQCTQDDSLRAFCEDLVTNCFDEDGDGFGGGPGDCPDCDDTNPRANPGLDEICGDRVDNNCDGEVDEFCEEEECCADGCADGQICSLCECVPFDPAECTTTGQPCSEPGQFVNGFFCSGDISDQPICIGICDSDAADPDSTCPQPGTVCAFGNDAGQGLCLEGCSLDRGCSTPDFGCFPNDGLPDDGLCVPTDDSNEIGDPCDPNDTFCEEGAFCLDFGQGQATCQQACRPFADEGDTDCDDGHCFPFSPDIGFCQEDTDDPDADSCDQSEQFQTCGEDARLCVPLGQFGGARCLDMCRTDLGDADCAGGESCRESQQFDGVGFCFGGF